MNLINLARMKLIIIFSGSSDFSSLNFCTCRRYSVLHVGTGKTSAEEAIIELSI
jgi:hypothetical protein